MAKKKEVKVSKDNRPLPVGFLIVGFAVFVVSLLYWGSGELDPTYGILGVVFGLILVFASFRSLRN